jgi:hypothetical protein
MTDPDDLALRALFYEAEDIDISATHEAFTASVMAQVCARQAKRKALFDSIWLALIIGFSVVALVLLPKALPILEVSFAQSGKAVGLSGESVLLMILALVSVIGWRVAVRD